MDLDLRQLCHAPVDYAGAVVRGCDSRGRNRAGVDLRDSQLIRCQLQDTIWDCAQLDQCVFHGSNASGARMRAASIKEMNWSDSQAIGMDMSEAQWVSVNFVKTDMTDVCLKGASLKQVSFTECAWGKADMSGTRQEERKSVGKGKSV